MLGLMLYIFLSAGSAHVWMGIFLAQVLVAICMATEPGQWNEWLKIWFALLTPVVLIILTGLFVMLTGYDLHIARFVREPHLPIRYVLAPPLLVASLPVVLFAMRKSRVFVEAD